MEARPQPGQWSPVRIPSYTEWIRRKTEVSIPTLPTQQQHGMPQQDEAPDVPPVSPEQQQSGPIPSLAPLAEISLPAPLSCPSPPCLPRPAAATKEFEDSCATLVETDERDGFISLLKRKRCDDEELELNFSENIAVLAIERWANERGLEGTVTTAPTPQEDSKNDNIGNNNNNAATKSFLTDKAVQAQMKEETPLEPVGPPSKRVKVEKGYPYARNVAWTLGSAVVGAVLGVAAVGIFC